MERAKLQAVQPVLPVRDVAAAVEFYLTRLGFNLHFQDAQEIPRYAVIWRDSVVLHLQWHDAEEWARVERPMLRFVVPQIEQLYEELKPMEVFHENTALRNTPWGTREFAFFDPDHNGLTFYVDLLT